MDEKTLVKVALICSLLGILLLMFIAERIDISESNITGINKEWIDKEVKIKGTVSALRDTPAVLLLDVKDDTGKIKVIVFKKEEKIPIGEGDTSEITGIVKEYGNTLEIEAKTVKIF